MKKKFLPEMLYQLASPVAVILLGLVLLICPDTASALAARILGWILSIVGIGFGIAAIIDRDRAIRKGVTAVILACVGGWISANPLMLAAWIGRMMGLLIAARGVRDLLLYASRGYSRLLALITAGVGVVLMVLPLTTSRLVFSLIGLVVLAIGIMMLLDRLKNLHYLPQGKDNIIDAL